MLCKSYIDNVYTFCVKCKHIFILVSHSAQESQSCSITFSPFQGLGLLHSMAGFPRLVRFEVSRGAAASAPWQTLEGNRPMGLGLIMGHMLLVVPAYLQVMPRLAAELQDQLNQKAMIAAGNKGGSY